MSDELTSNLHRFQERIGYHFHDSTFLLRALTHPSYVNEHPGDEIGDN